MLLIPIDFMLFNIVGSAYVFFTEAYYITFRHCEAPKIMYSNGLSALTKHLGISSSLEKRIEKFYGVAFVITILFVLVCFIGTLLKAC